MQNRFLVDRDYFKKIVDQINNVNDGQEKDILKKKSLFLSVRIERGQLKFFNLEKRDLLFVPETLQFLKESAASETNMKLKLRCYYLLWNSPKKHTDHLKEIFKFSLSIMDEDLFLYRNYDDYLVLENFVCLFYKSQQYSKICLEKTNKFLCLEDKRIAYYKYRLLWIVARLKKYEYKKLQNLECCIDSVFDYFIEKRDSLQADGLHELACLLSQKVGIETAKWHLRTGEIYEKHADFRLSDIQPLVSYRSFIRAKEYYQDANEVSKVEGVELKIREVKKRPMLSRVSGLGLPQNVLEALYVDSLSKANGILGLNSEEVFAELLNVRSTLISSQYNPEKSIAQELNVFDNAEFDKNQNIYDRETSKNLEFDVMSLLIYRQYLDAVIYTFMNRVVIGLYLSKKFDSKEFINHISRITWFSTSMSFYTLTGREVKFEWMELISPSLELLFEVLESKMMGDHKSEFKLILIIDSLSVKFEGLLRQILQYNNKPTTKKVRNESQEMTLEDLINNEYISETFHKNEITFLKYILTRQGLNLRNSISHTYFKTNGDYHWKQLLYLLLALLIVGDKKRIRSI